MRHQDKQVVSERGEVLALMRLMASAVALERKIFEVLQPRADCK